MYDANQNVSSMVGNVTRINSEITINTDASAKILNNIVHAKMILFGILLHSVVKMVNM